MSSSRLVTVPAGDNATNSLVTNFTSDRLWIAGGDDQGNAVHLVGASTAGGQDAVIGLPPAGNHQQVFTVTPNAAWLEITDGLAELAMPSGERLRTWSYRQLVRPAIHGWMSPILVANEAERTFVVGDEHTARGGHGRFAVSSISVGSGVVQWTTLLPDRADEFGTPGEGPAWLAADAADVYLLLSNDPVIGTASLIKLSTTTGRVQQRVLLNVPGEGNEGARVMLTPSSVLVQIDVNGAHAWQGRLIRLDLHTLQRQATIDIGGMDSFDVEATGTVNVLAVDCAGVAWLWRLDPGSLAPIGRQQRLPGDAEVILGDGAGNSWVIGRDARSLRMFEVAPAGAQ